MSVNPTRSSRLFALYFFQLFSHPNSLDILINVVLVKLRKKPCRPINGLLSVSALPESAYAHPLVDTEGSLSFQGSFSNLKRPLKARLHRRFLSRQLDAIFVAAKLDQVSNMFETPAISRREIALKIALGLHVRF